MARDRKELANVAIRLIKHVAGAETWTTLLQTVFTLTKRDENVERLVIWQVCVDLLDLRSPRQRVVRRAREVAKVRMLSELVGIVVRVNTCRRTTAGKAGSQGTIVVGSVGSYFGVGSVSEVTLEPTVRMCVKGNPLTSRSTQVLK